MGGGGFGGLDQVQAFIGALALGALHKIFSRLKKSCIRYRTTVTTDILHWRM